MRNPTPSPQFFYQLQLTLRRERVVGNVKIKVVVVGNVKIQTGGCWENVLLKSKIEQCRWKLLSGKAPRQGVVFGLSPFSAVFDSNKSGRESC